MNFGNLTTCSKCHNSFDSEEAQFYYNKRYRHYYTWCKECHKARVATRKKAKARRDRPLSSDPIEDKFIRLRISLVRRNKKHECETVTTRELIDIYKHQEGKCYYTGLQYSLTEQGPLYMTADRIDNSIGYTKDNIALCCWYVNCAKNKWPLAQMKELWKHLPTE